MDGRAPADGPAPNGATGGCVPQGRTVRDHFIADVHDADDLGDEERARILDMGLRALRGEPGLGVV
jgi:hypothetical protein